MRTRPKHFNNEQLLAYLDGELSKPAAEHLKRHLESCWTCRASLAQLELDVYELSRALATPSTQDWRAAQRARLEFDSWCLREQAAQSKTSKTRNAAPRLLWLAAAAGVMLIVAGLGVLRHEPVKPAEVRPNLAQAKLSESLAYDRHWRESDGIVQQRYKVTIGQNRPRVRSVSGQLQVWAQPSKGRYASRWSSEDGGLHFAVWRPDGDGSFWFQSASAKPVSHMSGPRLTPITLTDLASAGDGAFETLEARLQEWMRSHRCEPVSLAGEFSGISSAGGYASQVSEEGNASGQRIVTLTAQKIGSRCKVTVTLRMDENAGRPLSERVTFETAVAKYYVDLEAEETQLLQSAGASATLFRPALASITKPQARPAQTSPADLINSVPERDLVEAEVAARYLLHERGMCLGQPIWVRRDRSAGKVYVLGQLADQTLRHRLRTDLEALSYARFLRVNLLSLDNAAGLQAAVPVRRSSDEDIPISQRRSLLVGEHIDGLPISDEEKRLLKAEANHTASRYVSAGEALVREAAAYQTLVDARLNPSMLSTEAAERLEGMKQEHLHAMQRQLTDLATPLASLLKLPTETFPVSRPDESRQMLANAQRLQEALLDLFTTGPSRTVMASTSASALADSAATLSAAIAQLEAEARSGSGRNRLAQGKSSMQEEKE